LVFILFSNRKRIAYHARRDAGIQSVRSQA
jgi:hypothetical protein